jgi:hypothetical protein
MHIYCCKFQYGNEIVPGDGIPLRCRVNIKLFAIRPTGWFYYKAQIVTKIWNNGYKTFRVSRAPERRVALYGAA